MKLETEYALSFYEELAPVNKQQDLSLVRHIETGKLYIKKTLTIFEKEVFEYLRAHPSYNMPRVAEIVEDGSNLIVIEEYISGDPVSRLLAERGPFPEREAADMIVRLCDILLPLHSAFPPIVHRDIKPSNLIISADGVLKLIDFNAAKTACGEKGQDTVLIGTAGYAAPEQYGFGSSNNLTDIYAMGALLNELLTGFLPNQRPYGGKLGQVIDKCTELEPRMRYQSVDELKRALLHCLPVMRAEAETKNDYTASWVLPGFRSRQPWKMALAILGYSEMLLMALAVSISDSTTWYALLLNSAIILPQLLSVFFICNYRGVQSAFPLARSENKVKKTIGLVLGSVLASLIIIVVLAILQPR